MLDTPPQNCISADNAPLEVDAVLYCAPFARAAAARVVIMVAFYVLVAALAVRRHHLRPAALRVRRAQPANRHLEPRAHADPLGDRQADARGDLLGARALSATLLQSIDEGDRPVGRARDARRDPGDRAAREIMRSMEMQLAAERQKRATILQARSSGSRAHSAAAEADARVRAAEAERTATVLAAEAAAAATKLRADADADAFAKQRDAARRALCALRDELGADEAMRLEALRLDGVNARLASSKNAKTLVVPRGDEWLARLGVVLGADDAAPPGARARSARAQSGPPAMPSGGRAKDRAPCRSAVRAVAVGRARARAVRHRATRPSRKARISSRMPGQRPQSSRRGRRPTGRSRARACSSRAPAT